MLLPVREGFRDVPDINCLADVLGVGHPGSPFWLDGMVF
jgi:hypothetical protein